MPHKKVPEFTELTSVANNDKIYIVDVSDTTDDATGSSRYAQVHNLRSSSEVVIATNIITAVESDTTFYLNAAGGFTSTLPAPAIGLKYKFIVKTAPTTAYIITTTSGAILMYGTWLDVTGELTYFAARDTFNFVANKSKIGDSLEVESDGTNWYCQAQSGLDAGITTAQS